MFLLFCRSVRKDTILLELEDIKLKYMQFSYHCFLKFPYLHAISCFDIFPFFPECSLRLYGSSLTKFALKSSDVNIDIKFPPKVSYQRRTFPVWFLTSTWYFLLILFLEEVQGTIKLWLVEVTIMIKQCFWKLLIGVNIGGIKEIKDRKKGNRKAVIKKKRKNAYI